MGSLAPRRKQGQAEPPEQDRTCPRASPHTLQPGTAQAGPGFPRRARGAQPRAAPLPLSLNSLPCVSQHKAWTRPAWPRSCCLADCSPLRDEVMEVLGRQQENSASSRSFLRHLRQRCLRGNALQTARNSQVWKDLDEEAALVSDWKNNSY